MSNHFNPQNPHTQEQTEIQPEKKKASLRKKTILGGVGAIIILGMVGACSPDDTTPTTTEAQVSTQATTPATTQVEQPTRESSIAPKPQAKKEAQVPREYQQALKKAESYLKYTAFSEQGLYDQLTSEYGSKFPAEAAQYAMDNIKVDWNAQAVKKAESYLKFTSFSEQGLYDQMTSQYGSKFTPEQARHAISVVF